jgi:hypothetical protein
VHQAVQHALPGNQRAAAAALGHRPRLCYGHLRTSLTCSASTQRRGSAQELLLQVCLRPVAQRVWVGMVAGMGWWSVLCEVIGEPIKRLT